MRTVRPWWADASDLVVRIAEHHVEAERARRARAARAAARAPRPRRIVKWLTTTVGDVLRAPVARVVVEVVDRRRGIPVVEVVTWTPRTRLARMARLDAVLRSERLIQARCERAVVGP